MTLTIRTESKGLGLVGALAFSSLLWFATPRGLGLSPDSVAYLKAAQGLIDGQGFSYFSVQWPPLFSSAIYVFSQFVDGDFVRGARLLNASLYGCTFFLTAALLRCATDYKLHQIIIYFFATVFCLHPAITHIYFYAFSEALFLPLVLLNLLVLFSPYAKEKQSTLKLAMYLSLIGCLATSTRYAGLVLIALNSIMLWMTASEASLKKKLLLVIFQLIPTAGLLIKWRSHIGVGDTEANLRPLVWHPLTRENIADGLSNLGTWFLPVTHANESLPIRTNCILIGAIATCILFLIAARSTWYCYQKADSKSIFSKEYGGWIISIFCAGYIIFLILMRSLFDPNIIFDSRTLSPIFFPILILLISFFSDRAKGRLAAVTLLLIACIYLLPLQQIRPWLLISYFNGIGLNDKTRLSSDLLRVLRSCPKDSRIHSDQPWNLNLEFQSMVHWLPMQSLYGSWLVNQKYTSAVAQLPMISDLIVIEDLNSTLILEIDRFEDFRRAYESTQGIVWVKASLIKNYCSAM